jgi:hypothetical protein
LDVSLVVCAVNERKLRVCTRVQFRFPTLLSQIDEENFMLAKFSIWFISIAVLSLASVESVSAGFFDDLVEEGKKKLKEETDKVLKPGQGQPTSPRSPQPSQGAGRTQAPSSMPMSAGPDTITEIGPPALRKIQGHTVYDISLGYMQERDANFNRMKKWFDYLP